MEPNARRVRLDDYRLQNKDAYVAYEPDKVSGVPFNIGNLRLFLQTFPVDGWHLIYPEGNPYLISHSVIEFKAHPAGSSDWENYEAENEKFLRNCYSSRAIGARGSGLTADEYLDLSSWIQSIAGDTPTYLKSKYVRGIVYKIAVACGSAVKELRLSNGFMEASRGSYTFRPTVKLSPDMFIIIDDEHDGSTPEKGLRLEPANGYDPSKFDTTISYEKETCFAEVMRIIDEIKSMKPTNLEFQISKLEEIITLLKSSN